jgi:hypothetical protein
MQYADLHDCEARGGHFSTGKVVEILDDDTTLTAADAGKHFGIGTDAKTITLPTAVVGMTFSFTNIGADGNNIITVSPAATDGIWGTITLAASVVDLGGVDNKDLINTKATAIKGDSATLVCFEANEWTVVHSTGIWAAEA